jgi:hypothetical protein
MAQRARILIFLVLSIAMLTTCSSADPNPNIDEFSEAEFAAEEFTAGTFSQDDLTDQELNELYDSLEKVNISPDDPVESFQQPNFEDPTQVSIPPDLGIPNFREPKPATVEATVDESNLISKFVGPDGGVLETSGVDGSTYVLTIPAGALAQEELISITPLVSVSGWPLSDNAIPYGVRIEPDGETLFEFATLTITPAVDIESVRALTAKNDGSDFHFGIISLKNDVIELPIIHFSDHYGVADSEIDPGPKNDPGEITPNNRAGQLENELADMMAEERNRQLQSDPSEVLDLPDELIAKFNELMAEYHRTLIQPYLSQWLTDCETWNQTHAYALSWSRHLLLFLGIEQDPRVAAIWDHFMLGIENCIEELIEPCLHPKNLEEALKYLRLHQVFHGTKYGDDFDIEEVICGDIWGLITKTTNVNQTYYGAVLESTETIEVWVSITNPSIPEMFDPEAPSFDNSYFKIRGESSSHWVQEGGPCDGKKNITDTKWAGSQHTRQGHTVLSIDINDGNKMQFAHTGEAPGSSTEYTLREIFGEPDYCVIGQYSFSGPMSWDVRDSEVIVDDDRLRLRLNHRETRDGTTITITGELQSKTPLPEWTK